MLNVDGLTRASPPLLLLPAPGGTLSDDMTRTEFCLFTANEDLETMQAYAQVGRLFRTCCWCCCCCLCFNMLESMAANCVGHGCGSVAGFAIAIFEPSRANKENIMN